MAPYGHCRTSDSALARQDGFTLVELMVAALVLIVGMLGVLGMLTGALGTTATSNKRVAATNLARELVETTRGLDYDELANARTELQARGLGSGSPWTIERRGVTYTITATTCAYDDPADGYGATAPANACSTNTAGTDINGDDFRRVTFDVSWTDRGATRSVTQSTLIVDPTGGRPRILTITPVAQTITTNISTVNILWTTTPAQSLRWAADDGVSGGEITGTTSFTTAWDIGTSGSGTEVLDGSYVITATPYNSLALAGEGRRADVVLNRRAPYAPSGFTGGHDTRIDDWVDFEWSLNRERDVLGYRVVWAGPDGVGNGNDRQVCPAPAAGSMLPRSAKSCADLSPDSTAAQTYYIVAIDRDSNNQLRDGTPQLLTVPAADTRPAEPTGPLTVTTVADGPRLNWSAPATGGAAFYRIYRDDSDGNPATVQYADRYDTALGGATSFTDSNAGSTSRTYWVTTVDSSYNESDPIGPVTWTP